MTAIAFVLAVLLLAYLLIRSQSARERRSARRGEESERVPASSQARSRAAPVLSPEALAALRNRDHVAMLETIHACSFIPFESAGRGAACTARFSSALPRSESPEELEPKQRALEAIARTWRHPHRHEAWTDQFGRGWNVEFFRHVTEEGRRWELSVHIFIGTEGQFVIQDANLVRADDEREAGASTSEVPQGMVACPCCGHASLSHRGGFEICPICFWEDDGQDNADAHIARGGPNRVSLLEGRRNYLRFGASDEGDRELVRKPILEEQLLRRFDEEGQESDVVS